jgi:N-acetylneuraminic acid mutarotase
MYRRLWLCVVLGCACGDDGAPRDANPDDAAPACETALGWNAAPPMPLGATQETATVAVDGRIYVLGGLSGSMGVLSAVQVYDTQTCRWSLGPELPTPVHHANAAVFNGTIYVVGAMETLQFRAVGHTWSWSPSTEHAWTILPSMPTGTERGSSAVGVIGDRIFVAGGLRGGATAEVSSFRPSDGQWDTALPPLPAARDHGCGSVVDGKLYVTGGRRGATLLGEVHELTPGGDWVDRSPLPTPRGGVACGIVAGRIIVAGGEGNRSTATGVFAEVEAYDPATSQWTSLAPMVTPRHGMGAAVWNDQLYVPGGATQEGFGAVATHEVFSLAR